MKTQTTTRSMPARDPSTGRFLPRTKSIGQLAPVSAPIASGYTAADVARACDMAVERDRAARSWRWQNVRFAATFIVAPLAALAIWAL